jgi:uncharacterized membrane protein HdeD (DUF308 family)
MAQRAPTDPQDMIATVGRSWGWLLFFGIVSIVAGILITMDPGQSLVFIAVLIGAWLFVSGIFRLVEAIADREDSGGFRVAVALLGVVSILFGLYIMRNVGKSLALIALLIGIFWVVGGIIEFIVAISHKGMPGRGWRIFMGVLGFVAGVIVLEQPAISLVALTWVMGIWFIVYGIMEVVVSLQVRKLRPA